MAFLLTFSSKCYVSGKLKKGKTALQIVHDRPRENKNDEESGGSTLSFINPHDALLLFKQMLDQVNIYAMNFANQILNDH